MKLLIHIQPIAKLGTPYKENVYKKRIVVSILRIITILLDIKIW